MDIWSFSDFDDYASTVLHLDLNMILRHMVKPQWTMGQLDAGKVYVILVPLKNADVQQANGVKLSDDAAAILNRVANSC